MKNFIEEVKQPSSLQLAGCEALSLGESLAAYFKEFNLSIDKKMASLKGTIHEVNYSPVQKYLNNAGVSFVKNAGKETTAPSHFSGGFGEMDNYVQKLISGIIIVNGLKTEANRLYDWMKNIVKTGRIDRSFRWTVTGFDELVTEMENFIRELDDNRRGKFYLDQVYNSFDNAFDLMNRYNNAVRTIKARDLELMDKEITMCYDMGSLLITKIKNNDMQMAKETLTDLQEVVDKFVHLVNICGVIMGLLNELTAVFQSNLDEFKRLK